MIVGLIGFGVVVLAGCLAWSIAICAFGVRRGDRQRADIGEAGVVATVLTSLVVVPFAEVAFGLSLLVVLVTAAGVAAVIGAVLVRLLGARAVYDLAKVEARGVLGVHPKGGS